MATITIERTVTYVETYVVAEVENEEEAFEIIWSGNVDPDESEDQGDGEYTVVRVEPDAPAATPGPAPVLVWESAGNDEPGDQRATSRIARRAYWSLGPDWPTGWSVELVTQDEDGNETSDGVILGVFATEPIAKAAAETYERENRTENPR